MTLLDSGVAITPTKKRGTQMISICALESSAHCSADFQSAPCRLESLHYKVLQSAALAAGVLHHHGRLHAGRNHLLDHVGGDGGVDAKQRAFAAEGDADRAH